MPPTIKTLIGAIQSAGKAEKYDVASDAHRRARVAARGRRRRGQRRQGSRGRRRCQARRRASPVKAQLPTRPAPKIEAAIARNDASKQIEHYQERPSSSAEGGQGERRQGHEVRQQDRADARRRDRIRRCRSPSWKPREATGSSRGTRRSRRSPISRRRSRRAFASETTQKKAVADAVSKLGELQSSCRPASTTSSSWRSRPRIPRSRPISSTGPRTRSRRFRTCIETDELMKNLDNNEVLTRTCRSSGR